MLPLAFSHSPPLSYERLGHRIQLAISSPHVQKKQYVEVKPIPGDSPEDWRRLIADLEETTGIKVDLLESGFIRIEWREFTDG
ncbi:DUF1654 domain-containing protein [Pseudomonas sp. 17391]|uniref:DUF1654 domain-containing protein n=1 Tax=Pseudomonas capeferrum TaxID=1495066 RepID=A0ABY7RDW6_9PSED|nr:MULTISPECIES: DUF1654 domain-containing protein [Pseudomonas]KGI94265.1 ATP-dependent hsl protease ATP-binding subunit hslU (ATP-bindingprotein lapA) [Pseudomonas sp. H2]MDD2129925.1 DUF1654 domain-containing protein [Pseudomonas sp. 17391]MUT49977.1 DUF1654 domain-containing protein [Pseudomonas sp. TDA1]WCI02003.1 DUF1654 domain-containing protein [Pseudomonas capeferrum]